MSAGGDRLEKYAELVVGLGANVQPGQEVFILANVAHRDLARALTRASYKAGASYVHMLYSDSHVRKAMIEFGPDEPEELHPGDPLHTAGVAIIKRAAAETKVLLRDNWLAVVRVAGAFVKHDRLTQTELDHATALAPQA